MTAAACMRVVIVGYGVQGKKRLRVAGPDGVGVVDPVAPEAQLARHPRGAARQLRRARWSARRTSRRWRCSSYLLGNGKHVLVEKPLHAEREERACRARSASRARPAPSATPPTITASSRTTCACATSSRRARSGASIAAACSTATARRGWCAIPPGATGAGVLPDLGSHLLDTARFWFGDIGEDFRVISVSRFENRAPDHVVIALARRRKPEARARDDAAVVAQPFHLRRAGRERHRAHRVAVQVGADDVHASHARAAERPPARAERRRWCRTTRPGRSNTSTSSGCARTACRPTSATTSGCCASLGRLSSEAIKRGGTRMSKPTRRLCRHDPSRPLLRDRGGEQGLRDARLRSRTRDSGRAARAPASCRWSSRTSTTCCAANRARMPFTADPARLADCDLVYVAPDVPTDDSGGSDLAASTRCSSWCSRHARADAVVVVLSQVPPGYTRARQRAGRPALLSGRDADVRPRGGARDQARALHRRLRRARRSRCRPPLDDFLAAFGCPILPMRFESAELAKISINCCLVASVTVANTLAELCERIGADWSEIAPALRLDRRIGAYSYLGARPRHRRRQSRARPRDRACALARSTAPMPA